MTANEYLAKTLEEQTFKADSEELEALETQGGEVKRLLEEHFAESSPTIEYGGSKAKGTMIRAAFDLDMICYFPRDDDDAGGTLKDIYEHVEQALQAAYLVERKPSALRLRGKMDGPFPGSDFHIDVVPGRFIDGDDGDVFLYQSSGEKERLKTNLRKHISHVRKSGVIDAIRLMKLWRFRNGLTIKHFALELLVIDLLAEKKTATLSDQLLHLWTKFRDESDNLTVTDPANEDGNDLSGLLSPNVRVMLSAVAKSSLDLIEAGGWEAVFGALQEPEEPEQREVAYQAAIARVTKPSRPWCDV